MEKDVELRFNANSLMAVFLAVLFAAGAFQTLQLVQLSNQVNAQEAALGNLKAGTNVTGLASAAPTVPQQGTQGTVPSSLQNLPEMVGGC